MNTEIFLYRPNLVKNWNFKNDTEWTISDTSPAGGGWTLNGDGYAEFTPGFGSATMTQDILKISVTYSIRLKISNMTTGYVRVRTGTGFYDFNSNGWNEIQLTADSETFTIEGDFDGKISKVSVIEYPEVVKLDDVDEISIPLTFNVADIREPDKRNANYSKTVTVNGTKNNNKIFHEIFEISLDGIFNPNKATRAVIYQDSIEIFRGIIQLKKINRLYPNGDITYEIIFLGKIANLFNEIGNKDLNELDLSEYDHIYDLTNQKLSWDTSITKDDITYVNFSGGNPTGEGYVYPFINYGDIQNEYTWNVQNFKPAVYAKTYIDKIFEDANYTYDSNFFDSEFFKRLIIPYNEILTTDSFVDINLFDRSFQAAAPTLPATLITLNATSSPTTIKLALDAIVSDPSSQVDLANDQATFVYSGRYRFYVSFIWRTSGTTVVIADLVKVPSGGSPQILETHVLFPPVGGTYVSVTQWFDMDGYDFEQGDTVYANITYYKVGGGIGSETIEIQYQDLYCEALSNAYGAIIQMNSVIPKKIKQKDFLSSIFNLFNLYVETDKSDERKLLIEPRDDYYNAGSTIDWTNKLDISRQLELSPMSELNAKNYLYTYKSDGDYLNKLYNDQYKEVYGQHKETVDNDFIVDESKTEVIFSPTPLKRNGNTDRVISTIYQFDPQTTNTKDIKHNIRILYYAGVIATADSWDYVAGLNEPTTISETSYPYAGHFDDPSDPYIDLNFGYARELYYEPALWSPNTLYSVYYKKMIDEITDKDSKLVTGYFYIKAKDIFELDFRNQFYIDGYYLRLNKIIDFDINKNEPIKCEFILTKNKEAWVTQDPILKPVDAVAFLDTEILSGYNVVSVYSDVQVKGEKNTIGSGIKSSIVYGNENTIGDDCYNISLLSSNNVIVEPGLDNVHVVGTDNVTITSSNTTYINGTYIDTSGLPFKFNGIDIETNYTLGSPVVYPKILPTDTQEIDLGSSTKRFKDLYLENSNISTISSLIRTDTFSTIGDTHINEFTLDFNYAQFIIDDNTDYKSAFYLGKDETGSLSSYYYRTTLLSSDYTNGYYSYIATGYSNPQDIKLYSTNASVSSFITITENDITLDANSSIPFTIGGNAKMSIDSSGINIPQNSTIEINGTGTAPILGKATLSGGTVRVNTTAVTTSSIILLTPQTGGTTGDVYISARTAGTSFTITSSNGSDTRDIGWLIVEKV